MKDAPEKIDSALMQGLFRACIILHEIPEDYLDLPAKISLSTGELITTFLNDSGEDILVISLRGNPGKDLYRETAAILSRHRVNLVALIAAGIFIDSEIGSTEKEASEPTRYEVYGVSDHVACQYPGPYFGSSAAARGEAFFDMNGAYMDPGKYSFPGTGINELAGRRAANAVVWHSGEKMNLIAQEAAIARDAGCRIASPFVAPWAMVMKANRIPFCALVITRKRM